MPTNTDTQPAACKEALFLADLHEMTAQMHSDSGDKEAARHAMQTARTIRQLAAALIDANGFCRSAHEVALRGGRDTHWEPFRDRLRESLERQHGVMYPETSPHHAARRAMR